MKRMMAAVAVALVGVACADNPIAQPSVPAAGLYQLVEMGGGPLPYVLAGSSDTTWFESGSFTLSDDGRFVKRLRVVWHGPGTGGGTVNDYVVPGSFTRQGDELTLSWDGEVGNQRMATLTNTELRVHVPLGYPDEVYRRVSSAAGNHAAP